MDSTSTRVMAAVSGHWLLGALPLAGTRIQEALNDPSTDFLRLNDVEVHAHRKRRCVAKLPTVALPKSGIEVVMVPSDKHEAPQKRWNNRAESAAYSAFTLVGEYCLWGNLHLSSKPGDSRQTLMHRLYQFFALTDVSLSHGDGPAPLRVPLAFANRNLVTCFEAGESLELEIPGAEAASSSRARPGTVENTQLVGMLENVRGLLGEIRQKKVDAPPGEPVR